LAFEGLKRHFICILLKKLFLIVNNTFLKAQPVDGFVETNRNMLLWDMMWSIF
jgi:hypothetical protein